MTLATRLRAALDAMPAGSLVPVEWVRSLVEEHGTDEGVDLTVADVATMLDRAPSTVRTWCGAGRLEGAYRLQGREWRIPRSALRSLRDDRGPDSVPQRNGKLDLGSWREVAK